MVTRISRRLQYADRFGLQQADQAIKKDLVRALVELITNSDDSYRRLESRGVPTTGRIIVEIQRKRQRSVIKVTDFAEGMDGDKLDRAVGIYAEATSGFSKGAQVRGYFGRGIKDAILGLGEGIVTGTVDNQRHRASLSIRKNSPHYEAQDPIDPGGDPQPNSTKVEVTVLRDDIRIPFFDNLRRQVSHHFALRDIITSQQRTVILKNLNASGLVDREYALTYQFPQGQRVHKATLDIPDFKTSCDVVLYRSNVPLDTPREQGYVAQAGLLIKSANAILDNTLLKFDGDVNAQRFYGVVKCPQLDELLRRDEPVITATRDGLDRAHPFVSKLFAACEELLEEFVNIEARKARAAQHRTKNKELQQKLQTAVSKLNDIAREELSELGEVDPNPNEPKVPEGGFGFVPEYVSVLTAQKKSLILRGLTRIIPEGSTVNITSDTPNVEVLTPTVVLQPRDDYEWMNESKVVLEGVQVGAEAIITAECDGLATEALARVVARIEHSKSDVPRPRRRRGLFNDIQFSDATNPRQRVRYDWQSKDVIVAINHSSVKPYVHDSTGAGTDTPQGQVMLAELISEAVCGTIARNGVASGRFAAPVGGEIEATQAQQLRLQNQYSGLIHEIIVSPEHRTPLARRTAPP